MNVVTSRVWRRRVTWRHQSTHHRHIPTRSLLDTNPYIA